MNIVNYLLSIFFKEEIVNTTLLVTFSFIINIFQTNIISYIGANIIGFVQKNNESKSRDYFTYFMAVSVLYMIFYYFYKYFQNKLLTKLRQWIRHELVKMVLLVNNENFKNINFTKLNSPINRISSVCFMVFNDIITFLLPNITFLFIIAIYFLQKNIEIGITFIIGNILLVGYLYYSWTSMIDKNETYEKMVSENEAYLVEILNNIDKIISRGQVENEIDVFLQKTEKTIHSAFEFYSNTNNHGIIMNIIAFTFLFILIFQLIRIYFLKKIDSTTFVTFFTILLLYRERITTTIQQIPDFIEFLGRSDSVMKHFYNMDADLEKIYNKNYLSRELQFNSVTFENVTFQYQGQSNPIMKEYNIHLNLHDKIIGIVGLSGNGKSTFAKLMIKMYTPTSGKIYIDDIDINEVDGNYIRSQMIYINQNSKLFDRKIIENILYGCYDLDVCNGYLGEIMKYPKIRDLFKSMDIHHKKAGLFGENLSGGQRQVVNIIGGLVIPSKIVILDEPTNALDGELKNEIIQLITDFKKYKRCIIIISHDKDTFGLFDETIQIE
jgi:ABC-type bacteriocin/lantibiotic exporter with double-glycine peptidase domain